MTQIITTFILIQLGLMTAVSSQQSRSLPSSNRPNSLQGTPKVRYLELFVVADHELYRNHFNYSESDTIDFITNHVSQVNAITKKLNVHIILSGYDVHTRKDPIERGDSLSDRFNKLPKLQSLYAKRYKYDVFYFITGYYYPAKENGSLILGKAYVNQTCTSQPLMATMYPSVEDDHHYTPEGFAVIGAHELGHLLGMKHDTVDCKCLDSSCVMAAAYEGKPSWSSCSYDIALNHVSSSSMDECFSNPSRRESVVSICGNGLIEDGEQCDCPYLDERCRRDCCDMSTCRLIGSSKCSSGVCCYNCQFKSSDVLCRPRDGNCDVPENCDGQAEGCPADRFQPTGSSCHAEGEAGFCYGAKCQTRNDQCKQFAGPRSRSCDDKYYEYNVRGDDRGYCDHQATEDGHPVYSNCSRENVLCGALKCMWDHSRHKEAKDGDLEILLITNKASKVNVRPIQLDQLDSGYCSTFTYVFAKDPRAGLVADGTKCGANRMCMQSECGDIRCLDDCNGHGDCIGGQCRCHGGYSGPSCVADHCPDKCYGRGQCDKRGRCTCFLDYGGDTCAVSAVGHPVYEDYVPEEEASGFVSVATILIAIALIVALLVLIRYYQKHKYTTCFLVRLRVESLTEDISSWVCQLIRR
ncbi:Disintegrin and metalloproteinase domain-containing protein 28 [Halotydeus destructor]|nr:Disintegrin and metalloproteinase domain-containing protein 28 [Halotydeus destructor]